VNYLDFSCFPGLGLLHLADLGNRFIAKGGASPVFLDLLSPLVEVGVDSLNKLVQGASVTGLNLKKNKLF
jgi:hypothetical protein